MRVLVAVSILTLLSSCVAVNSGSSSGLGETPPPTPESTATLTSQSAGGRISEVGEEYGNLETSLVAADLTHIGLAKGDMFTAVCNGNEISVYLGDTYSDVAEGEWIAFINWEGKLRLARNLHNASETLSAKAGDAVTISR